MTPSLLPGTTFGLGKTDYADGRAFVEENVPVALGSDINPGTCWCESMPFILALACRYEKLTPAEVIVAATIDAAGSLGLADSIGSLEPGKLADLIVLDRDILRCPVDDVKDTQVERTYLGGKLVYQRGKR